MTRRALRSPPAVVLLVVVLVSAPCFSKAAWLQPPDASSQHSVFSGHCQVTTKVGEGAQCDIFSQRLCRYPLVCSRGVCIKPTLGKSCQNHEECGDSETCQLGKCASVLGDGDPCTSNQACASGVCDTVCVGADIGKDCDSRAEGNPCAEGAYCAARGPNKDKCVESKKEGQDCEIDANVHTRSNLLDICEAGTVCDAAKGTFKGICTRISSYEEGSSCGRVFGEAVCQAGMTCVKSKKPSLDGSDGVCEHAIGRKCKSTSECPRNAECVCVGEGDMGVCKAVMSGKCERELQTYVECIRGHGCANSVSWRGFGAMIHGACAVQCKTMYKKLMCCQTEGFWRPSELACDDDGVNIPNEWEKNSHSTEIDGKENEEAINKLENAASAVSKPEETPPPVKYSAPSEQKPIVSMPPVGHHGCKEKTCKKHTPRKVPNGHLGVDHQVYGGSDNPIHHGSFRIPAIRVPPAKRCPGKEKPEYIECYGHGKCLTLTGQCECDEGWGSKDCSEDTALHASRLFSRPMAPEDQTNQYDPSYGERIAAGLLSDTGNSTEGQAGDDGLGVPLNDHASTSVESSSDHHAFGVPTNEAEDARDIDDYNGWALFLAGAIGFTLIISTTLAVMAIVKIWKQGLSNTPSLQTP